MNGQKRDRTRSQAFKPLSWPPLSGPGGHKGAFVVVLEELSERTLGSVGGKANKRDSSITPGMPPHIHKGQLRMIRNLRRDGMQRWKINKQGKGHKFINTRFTGSANKT